MSLSVAVVIPTHNRRDLVLRAVRSVVEQTRQADRVVVVDDGSSDDSARCVASQFPAVEVIAQPNAGVSAARNRGVAACSEEWVAFLDSDDEWRAQKLEQQAELLACASDDVALVHCDEIWIRRGNQVLQRKRHRKRGGRVFSDCLPLCAISPSAAVIRRGVLAELGGFDESMPACEDYDLWLRLTARYSTSYLDEPLVVKYGGHEDQLSRRFPVMDRFRIDALSRLLQSDAVTHLSQEELSLARTTLKQKVEIVATGARKRGRLEEAEALDAQLQSLLAEAGVPRLVASRRGSA